MSRDDILQLGLAAAKDEYLRGQSRLALVETKAQLVSATVGILLTFFVALPAEHVPHSGAADGLLLIGAIGSLVLSLIWSIAASLLVDVRPPQSAQDFCERVQQLIKEPGATASPVDKAAAEIVVGNLCGSYLSASKEVSSLLTARMKKLRIAQIALTFGVLLMIVLIGLPYLAKGIALFNGG